MYIQYVFWLYAYIGVCMVCLTLLHSLEALLESLASLWVLAPAPVLGGGVKGLLSSMSFKQASLSLLAPHSYLHPKEIN